MSVLKIYDKYEHLRCECGGIIGMYDRENFTCEKCGKEKEAKGKYDRLIGGIFPMTKRRIDLSEIPIGKEKVWR